MSIVENEKYSAHKINKLKDFLKRNVDNGKPIEYEIYVDGLKAVQRTNDPEHFDMHETFVDGDTKEVEILFYRGTSNYNDKRIYTFREPHITHQGLSGLEVEVIVQETLEKAKKENEFKELKKENIELKEEIEELEEEIVGLEAAIEKYKEKESPLNAILGNVGASIAETLAKRNPEILAMLPGGSALSGVLNEPDPNHNTQKTEQEQPDENEVSYEMTGSTVDEKAPELSVEDQHLLMFGRRLKQAFDKPTFDKVIEVLGIFINDMSNIDIVLDLLREKKAA